jgi:hypothetical protein
MEDTAMRILLCGAAALALLTLPAAAQDNVKSGNTLDPIALSKQAQHPAPKLTDQQAAAIRDGLVAVHTQQKAPQGFQPKPGDKLPKALKVEGLPQDVVRKDPAFRELAYAKTATDILVIDPMKKTIVAVIPRKFAADPNAKPPTAADWAATRGRELTGQAPLQTGGAPEAHQPAGDSGDTPNGDVNNAKPKK